MKTYRIYEKKKFRVVCFLFIFGLLTRSDAFGTDFKVDFYGSLRVGFDYVDTGTPDDSVNKRDFLSRLGVKTHTQFDRNFAAITVLEYGLKAVNLDDIERNQLFFRRLAYVGFKSSWGELYYGKQNLVFHTFLRSSYFSDFNDSIRQATIRDEDLLQYFYLSKNWKIGLSTQIEKLETDSAGQFEIAGEYSFAQSKYQLGFVKDNEGENTGELFGARFWWYPSEKWTLSFYYQYANENFDLYPGSTTGNVRLRNGITEGNIVGVRSCLSENRSSSGIYAKYKIGKHTLHGRLAQDACDQLGDVNSVKLEYVLNLYKYLRTWVSVEVLTNDASRAPLSSSGESLSEKQIGLRYDF